MAAPGFGVWVSSPALRPAVWILVVILAACSAAPVPPSPKSEPIPSSPPIECPSPFGWSPQAPLQCRLAIEVALASLPLDHPAIADVEFSWGRYCDTPMCAATVPTVGTVTFTFGTGTLGYVEVALDDPLGASQVPDEVFVSDREDPSAFPEAGPLIPIEIVHLETGALPPPECGGLEVTDAEFRWDRAADTVWLIYPDAPERRAVWPDGYTARVVGELLVILSPEGTFRLTEGQTLPKLDVCLLPDDRVLIDDIH
jgi:hypothetical protein